MKKNAQQLRDLSLVVSILAFLCWGLVSCNKPLLKTGEGNLPVSGGKIWYKVSGNGTGIPVVLIHGGPGASSFYLKPFEELGNDRQVIRYDQLGSGKSTYTEDTTMFTIEQRVTELDSLRKALGINTWNLLGHSFGTMVALEYYAAFPDHVASLIFAGPCFDVPAYEENCRLLLKTLPDSLQKAVVEADSSSDYINLRYQDALTMFNDLYGSRKPDRVETDSIMATFNVVLNYYMLGPSDISIIGTLKDYNSTPYLSKIRVPTLFTVGEFDTSGPQLVKSFSEQVAGSEYYVFPNSAHITMWDAEEENVRVVRNFLLSADACIQSVSGSNQNR